jgi:hypothetical protein
MIEISGAANATVFEQLRMNQPATPAQ